MDIAFCYEQVLPARGGCETYIGDLARRLATDGHRVHLYSCIWDQSALPPSTLFYRLPEPKGPRFLRAWRFNASCMKALGKGNHDLSIGFNKTWGQDILYPQAGLHIASADHNIKKHANVASRAIARVAKAADLAHWSYNLLENRQYLGANRPLIIVNSQMVKRHFQEYYGFQPDGLRILHSAIDPSRFIEDDRLRRRLEWRQQWGIGPEETVALFVAMNYHLKGLEPLLRAIPHVPDGIPFRLVVAGNPHTAPYERLVHRLRINNRVHFAGYCPDTRNCYFASDFLVHPTFYDPCSLVVLEARACGLPVITSRYNGASELLDSPQEGYVVDDPHDHKQLAWCISQLLNPSLRSAAARAVGRSSANWTFNHHYQQLQDIFAEVASRKRAA